MKVAEMESCLRNVDYSADNKISTTHHYFAHPSLPSNHVTTVTLVTNNGPLLTPITYSK